MKKSILAFLCLFIWQAMSVPLHPQESDIREPDRQENRRASVALVLAGGGAKGFAHVPILQMLEDLEIPIDMIVGTSAGALIGGFYAAGNSPAEIEAYIHTINWEKTFQDDPVSPADIYIDGQNDQAEFFSFQLDSGFNIEMGKGVFTGQHVFETIKRLTVKIPSRINFDSLPTPFRAVAVDLLNGEPVVLSGGDLAEAMRASMSLPALFEPFVVDGRTLIDGTVLENVPIKIAKDMGFDIIIVVDISDELIKNPEAFETTPLAALSQMMSITQAKKTRDEYQYADIVIKPDLSKYTSIDYLKGDDIIAEGRKAALAAENELRALRDRIYGTAPVQKDVRVRDSSIYDSLPYLTADVLITDGEDESDTKLIHTLFENNRGKPVTPEALTEFVSAVFATGKYLIANPSLYIEDGISVLHLQMFPERTDKNRFIIGGGFAGTFSTASISKFELANELQLRGLTGKGSIISFKLSLINTFAFQTYFFQPLSRRTFLQIGGKYTSDQDLISRNVNNPAVVGYKVQTAGGGIYIGAQFDKHNRLTAGASFNWINTFRDKAEDGKNKYANKIFAISAEYLFSSLNSKIFPTSGFMIKLNNRTAFPLFAADVPVVFDTIELSATAAFSVNPQFSIVLTGTAASDVTQSVAGMNAAAPVFGFSLADRHFFPQITT